MMPLWNLALATAAFVGTHLLMSHAMRKTLVRKLGERGFLGLYSAVAALTLGWMIWARLQAPAEPLWWIASEEIWDLATVVMLLPSILLVGSLQGNPALVDPTGERKTPDRPHGVLAITRHPMMWAFMLWALVHIALWGSAANVIVSGGIFILALAGSLAQDAKKRRLLGPDWIEWQRKTAYVPLAGQLSGHIGWRDTSPGAFAIIGGIIFWLAATWAHAPAGGPLAGIWRWLSE